MEEADSFKERNKAMTDALLVERSVRLTVYDFDYFFEEKREQIKGMLTELSGLHIKIGRGVLLRKKFYAYFDDVDSANVAAFTALRIVYCKTRVHRGTFDVTNLVIDNNTIITRNLMPQEQSLNTEYAIDAENIVNEVKYFNIKKYCKYVKEMTMTLTDKMNRISASYIKNIISLL